MERDAKLGALEERADALQDGCAQFEKQAAAMKNKFWLENLKMIIAGCVVGAIVIGLLYWKFFMAPPPPAYPAYPPPPPPPAAPAAPAAPASEGKHIIGGRGIGIIYFYANFKFLKDSTACIFMNFKTYISA